MINKIYRNFVLDNAKSRLNDKPSNLNNHLTPMYPPARIIYTTVILAVIAVAATVAACSHSADGPMPPGAGYIEEVDSDMAVRSALRRLDSVLAERPAIMAAKRRRIDSLTVHLANSRDAMERITSLKGLYEEYRSFSMDTTLFIAQRYVSECRELNNDSLVNDGRLMIAEGLKGLGYYHEALDVLSEIPENWRAKRRVNVINRYISVYYSLADYAPTPEEAELYREKRDAYRDSLTQTLNKTEDSYWVNMAEKDRVKGQPEKALNDIDSLLHCPNRTVDKGVIAYSIACSYEALGEIEKAKYYYAVGAARDISNAVRKYEALQELARILAKQGDYERAYNYIMTAINDITASKARSRIQRIAGYLPIITGAYHDAEKSENNIKNWLIVLSGVLVAGLIVFVLVIRRQNKRLTTERLQLTHKNAELEQLQQRLSLVNRNLVQSSKVKEQYLGYLFSLCSEYIMSLDKYRARLARRIKSGKVKDLTEMLSPSAVAEHLQNFYDQFDSIFLDIYPDFITKINTLFIDGFRLEPRPGEKLSPELRIYALVRLGIVESTQIATFLNYSTQTVYNYRSRVRQHARPEIGSFAEAVRNL